MQRAFWRNRHGYWRNSTRPTPQRKKGKIQQTVGMGNLWKNCSKKKNTKTEIEMGRLLCRELHQEIHHRVLRKIQEQKEWRDKGRVWNMEKC